MPHQCAQRISNLGRLLNVCATRASDSLGTTLSLSLSPSRTQWIYTAPSADTAANQNGFYMDQSQQHSLVQQYLSSLKCEGHVVNSFNNGRFWPWLAVLILLILAVVISFAIYAHHRATEMDQARVRAMAHVALSLFLLHRIDTTPLRSCSNSRRKSESHC